MPNEHRTTNVATVYAGAPSIILEICWVAQQGHSIDVDQHREFWLRKAATLDRIALKGAAAYVPAVAGEAVEAAISAARQLVEYDIAHNGLSRKGHELVTGEDYREYVRQEYHAWSRDQRG